MRAGDVDDVVVERGAKHVEPPAHLPGPVAGTESAAEAGFGRVRNHLLKGRIGDQEVVDHARRGRARAAESSGVGARLAIEYPHRRSGSGMIL